MDKDGYRAVQLGFGKKKKKNEKKPQLVCYEKIDVLPQRFVKELPYGSDDLVKELTLGQEINLDVFEGVAKVDVTSFSKGKGFAGCIKRHGFSRGPLTHGSRNVREPGSTGSSATPGKTIKGKKMPGRYGGKKITVRNINIVHMDKEKNLLFVKGAVPGAKGSYLVIRKNIDVRNQIGVTPNV